jgi:hypothetical protein
MKTVIRGQMQDNHAQYPINKPHVYMLQCPQAANVSLSKNQEEELIRHQAHPRVFSPSTCTDKY